MQNGKKLSVVIPVFNTAVYLDQCINSVLNQTLEEMEIIIINDGSTDNSAEIIRTYAQRDKRIIFIDNEQNSGFPGIPRNIGLQAARGNYIAFLDSDDWIKPEMYERMYNLAVNENIDIVMCDFEVCFPNNTIPKRIEDLNSSLVYNCHDTPEILLICPAFWNKIFRRELIKDIEIKELKRAEDVLFFWETMIKAKSIKRLDKLFYCYRIRIDKAAIRKRDQFKYDIFRHFAILQGILIDKKLHHLMPAYDIHKLNGILYELQEMDFPSKKRFFKRAVQEVQSISLDLKLTKRQKTFLTLIKKDKFYSFLFIYTLKNFFEAGSIIINFIFRKRQRV